MTGRGRMDWLLFAAIVITVCVGLVFVYSASSLAAELRYHKENYYFLMRQGAAALIGFLLLTYLSQQDYRKLQSSTCAFAGIGIVIFLLIVAYKTDPQKRWVDLGFTTLQPSELAKPALIVFLAWFVTLRAPEINSPHTVRPVALALIGVAGGVLAGDLGTAIVLVATTAAVFYLAGLNRRYTALAVMACLIFLAAAVVARPFRLKRIIDFLDPEYNVLIYADPERKLLAYVEKNSKIQDTAYHGMQAKIAAGAGGLTGRGLMNSRQKLLYLPAAHTDFIFSIIAEETGLIGSVLFLALFLFVLWRGYSLYWVASDDFGKYIAVGVTTCIVFQALLNMSVSLDMGPAKGIPLPLISYGGSSLLSSCICLGLLLSVSERSA